LFRISIVTSKESCGSLDLFHEITIYQVELDGTPDFLAELSTIRLSVPVDLLYKVWVKTNALQDSTH
jgi:hypothetical protein